MNAEKSTLEKISIRHMESGDLNDVFSLYCALVGEPRAISDANMFAANLWRICDLSFVAETGSEVVGFVIAQHTYIGEPTVEAALIHGLGVNPLFQHRDIATRLINILMETAREKGIKTLRIMLNEQDSRTEGFFKRMNFHRAKVVIYDKDTAIIEQET